MHYSNDRILVTHAGSLPRSPAVLDMLGRMEAGEDVDRGEFGSEVLTGLREAVLASIRFHSACTRRRL